MKKGEIEAVIFDVGGVLVLGENSLLKKGKIIPSGVHQFVAKKLGISVDQYFDSIDTNYALAIEGKIPYKKIKKILSKNLKISEKKLESLYINSYRKHFKQNKQLFEQAFKLKKLGYKIGVLSDQWYLSKRALMPDKLYKNFNPVILSFNVGMRKPNPKIYNLMLKKLKISPSKIIFIDNQKWNLVPAKKLRMKTILFKNNKQLFSDGKWAKLFSK